MLHTLTPERPNLHGHFSRDLAPVLTIDPGDSVHFQCLDSRWGLEPHNGTDLNRREVEGRDPDLDKGHALTGPVAIRGTNPGMTLEVKINEIRVGDWGFTFAGGWHSEWNDRLDVGTKGVCHVWSFDAERQMGCDQHGYGVRLRPFMGIYGLAPAEPGIHSTTPPRRVGGNIDCKELIAGSTLYLPIEVEGALFSVGDGHAVQGDGELSITAIECPMERVDLTFNLRDDFPLDAPIALTPAGWVTLGFNHDLDEAVVMALESMLTLMKRLYGLERLDALALASLVVDMRVTQMVNHVRGAHAVLRPDAIRLPR